MNQIRNGGVGSVANLRIDTTLTLHLSEVS